MFLLFLYVSSFGMAAVNQLFDNHRRGFIIGGLGGIAVNTWDEYKESDPDDVKVNNGASLAIHADFRFGVGLGDKFMIYYWTVVNSFGGQDYDYKSEPSFLTFTFLMGPGVSYYFKPTSPSLYINAGIGGHLWDLALPSIGYGVMGGIRYEFTQYWSMECGVMWGGPQVGTGSTFLQLRSA